MRWRGVVEDVVHDEKGGCFRHEDVFAELFQCKWLEELRSEWLQSKLVQFDKIVFDELSTKLAITDAISLAQSQHVVIWHRVTHYPGAASNTIVCFRVSSRKAFFSLCSLMKSVQLLNIGDDSGCSMIRFIRSLIQGISRFRQISSHGIVAGYPRCRPSGMVCDSAKCALQKTDFWSNLMSLGGGLYRSHNLISSGLIPFGKGSLQN